MYFIELMFSGFWYFIGGFIILSLLCNTIFRIINRTLRHANIRKYGYPPAHCDADGDFKKEPETE